MPRPKPTIAKETWDLESHLLEQDGNDSDSDSGKPHPKKIELSNQSYDADDGRDTGLQPFGKPKPWLSKEAKINLTTLLLVLTKSLSFPAASVIKDLLRLLLVATGTSEVPSYQLAIKILTWFVVVNKSTFTALVNFAPTRKQTVTDYNPPHLGPDFQTNTAALEHLRQHYPEIHWPTTPPITLVLPENPPFLLQASALLTAFSTCINKGLSAHFVFNENPILAWVMCALAVSGNIGTFRGREWRKAKKNLLLDRRIKERYPELYSIFYMQSGSHVDFTNPKKLAWFLPCSTRASSTYTIQKLIYGLMSGNFSTFFLLLLLEKVLNLKSYYSLPLALTWSTATLFSSWNSRINGPRTFCFGNFETMLPLIQQIKDLPPIDQSTDEEIERRKALISAYRALAKDNPHNMTSAQKNVSYYAGAGIGYTALATDILSQAGAPFMIILYNLISPYFEEGSIPSISLMMLAAFITIGLSGIGNETATKRFKMPEAAPAASALQNTICCTPSPQAEKEKEKEEKHLSLA